MDQRVLTYSSYKSNQTLKVLVGIAPNGVITFISFTYGGRTTDAHITNDSGFLKLIQPGDEVMADKGTIHFITMTEFLKLQNTVFSRK